MDVAAVRARYPRLQMLGGIDKTALAEGPAAIDREIARVAPVVRSGGYVPGVDHYVPPEVPWGHFAYYRQRLAEILQRGRRPAGDVFTDPWRSRAFCVIICAGRGGFPRQGGA